MEGLGDVRWPFGPLHLNLNLPKPKPKRKNFQRKRKTNKNKKHVFEHAFVDLPDKFSETYKTRENTLKIGISENLRIGPIDERMLLEQFCQISNFNFSVSNPFLQCGVLMGTKSVKTKKTYFHSVWNTFRNIFKKWIDWKSMFAPPQKRHFYKIGW